MNVQPPSETARPVPQDAADAAAAGGVQGGVQSGAQGGVQGGPRRSAQGPGGGAAAGPARPAGRGGAREDQVLSLAARRAEPGDAGRAAPAVALRHPEIVPVPPARARPRHHAVAASFVLLVLLPVAVSAWYLWARAADRYASQAGFSVRSEEAAPAFSLLGGMANLPGAGTPDPDILYAFIRSQDMVAAVDAALDLRAIWARGDPDLDPVFAYRPPGTIEDLVAQWRRMVSVHVDSSSGLIEVEVQAFDPLEARAVARAIHDQSALMMNRLSALAREDATRHARTERDAAAARLARARAALTEFRNRTQIVDPVASLQSRMGLLAALEQQLAGTLIDLDLLARTTGAADPRRQEGLRRAEAIEARIADERRKLGLGALGPEGRAGAAQGLPNAWAGSPAGTSPGARMGGSGGDSMPEADAAGPGHGGAAPGAEAAGTGARADLPGPVGAGLRAGAGAESGPSFAALLGDYERLAADREIAEQAYAAALASYDAAEAEARRQSRYVAAHVQPTLAERAIYPRRAMLLGLAALFAFLCWALLVLGVAALRDRR